MGVALIVILCYVGRDVACLYETGATWIVLVSYVRCVVAWIYEIKVTVICEMGVWWIIMYCEMLCSMTLLNWSKMDNYFVIYEMLCNMGNVNHYDVLC